jgi:hypothetical protein
MLFGTTIINATLSITTQKTMAIDIVMLSVIMQNVTDIPVMLSVVMLFSTTIINATLSITTHSTMALNTVMLSVIMQNVTDIPVMLSVVMLNVIMPSAVCHLNKFGIHILDKSFLTKLSKPCLPPESYKHENTNGRLTYNCTMVKVLYYRFEEQI